MQDTYSTPPKPLNYSDRYMEITPLLCFAVVVIFILLKSFRPSKPKKNQIPEPWRLPIIGHMHHFIGKMPHRGITDLARKYGPLMHLRLGEVSTIVVSSPRWAKEVLKTHDIIFANRPLDTLTGEILAYHNTDIIFSPYGEHWRQLRKLCTLELLSAKKVKSFQSLREEECWNLVEVIKTSGSGKSFKLSEYIFMMISTIICRAAFGKRIKDQAVFIEIVKEALRLTGGFDIADVFPSKKVLHHLSGKRAKLNKIHYKISNLIDNIISEHSGSHLRSSQESLLDVLMRLKDSAEFPLTTNNVKAIILDMFAAGTDTSSGTIEWAMSELIRCPRAMEKVQKELRESLNGKERILEEDIQELTYLKNVVKETMRIHPPLPLVFPRESSEPCEMGGYNIPNKTKLIVNVFAIHRDPEYWKDPESFIPERFENSLINIMGSEYEYLPFSAGRRMCPGATLGLVNVELALANILYHFDWELMNGASYEELDMIEDFGATVQRKNGLVLIPMF